MKWTGNTGFLLVHRQGLDLLEKALNTEEDPTIWGIADQGALNGVAWREDRIHQLDQRWNYQPVLEYFLNGPGWHVWQTNRLYRISFYIRLLTRSSHPCLRSLATAWGVHLIRAPYPSFFDRVLT